ncbi:hypothetical protein C8R48DRAFT_790024 [Suillus tomentosus]|nr:hypothetical protein C8R48DRAFT_790024 [Suillus tomentosus]
MAATLTDQLGIGLLRTWSLEQLEDNPSLARSKLGPVLMVFVFLKYDLDFSHDLMVMDAHIMEHANWVEGLVANNAFIYSTISVEGIDMDIAFANPTIITLARYLLYDSEFRYHQYITGNDYFPLLAMIATQCFCCRYVKIIYDKTPLGTLGATAKVKWWSDAQAGLTRSGSMLDHCFTPLYELKHPRYSHAGTRRSSMSPELPHRRRFHIRWVTPHLPWTSLDEDGQELPVFIDLRVLGTLAWDCFFTGSQVVLSLAGEVLRPCTKGRTDSEGLGFSSCTVPLTRVCAPNFRLVSEESLKMSEGRPKAQKTSEGLSGRVQMSGGSEERRSGGAEERRSGGAEERSSGLGRNSLGLRWISTKLED